MYRLRAPMGIQLGPGPDQPDKHKPNEEIREAFIQALTSLLREALDYDALLELNRRVVERIKHLQSLQSQYLMFELHLGQRVSFDAGPEHGGRLFATLVKRNRKTMGLVTDDGRQWRVSPHLVTPLKDITPEKPVSKNAPKDRKRGR